MHRGAALVLGWLVLVTAAPVWADLSYTGSSTIGDHIIPEAARAFAARRGITIGSIETPGSGKGLDKVMEGQADLAGVARSLSAQERRRAIYYRIIGYDAVAVVVHHENPVTALTREQVKAIFSGRTANWRQVGGPDARIVVITDIWSNRRAQMVEFQHNVLDGLSYSNDRVEVDRQNEQAKALLSTRHGIAHISPAFMGPGLKALALEGYTPGAANVRSGAYLLSRPLIVVTQAPPRADARAFIDFLLTPEGQAIVGHHFVPVR
jgi:phosphate transport system substrate-binding protein